jgi:DNA-binding NtrC family response regulator
MKDLYQELGVRNILLVGNDPWIRETLSFFFQIRGCHLASAAGMREGVAALSGDRFDLILCEYLLPDGDGLSLLKLHGNRQPVAVKFLIAQSPGHQVVEEAARAGIHGVVPQPFSIEALEGLLKRCRPQPRALAREEVPVK